MLLPELSNAEWGEAKERVFKLNDQLILGLLDLNILPLGRVKILVLDEILGEKFATDANILGINENGELEAKYIGGKVTHINRPLDIASELAQNKPVVPIICDLPIRDELLGHRLASVVEVGHLRLKGYRSSIDIFAPEHYAAQKSLPPTV